jgi:hypothetical protein
MKVKVVLEKVIEVDHSLEVYGLEDISDIQNADDLEMLEDDAHNIEIEIKSIELLDENE